VFSLSLFSFTSIEGCWRRTREGEASLFSICSLTKFLSCYLSLVVGLGEERLKREREGRGRRDASSYESGKALQLRFCFALILSSCSDQVKQTRSFPLAVLELARDRSRRSSSRRARGRKGEGREDRDDASSEFSSAHPVLLPPSLSLSLLLYLPL